MSRDARALARPLIATVIACASVTATLSGGAHAQTAPRPVRLDYVAPEGCPDREAIVRAVRAEARSMVLAADGEPARALVLRIDPEGATLRGSVWLVAPGGATSFRALHGASCPEVASALALMAALALDGPDPPPPAPAPSPAPAPAPAPSPAPPLPLAPIVVPRTAAPRWTWGVGARALGYSAVAPDLAWGMEALAQVASTRGGGLSPALALSVAYVASPTAQIPSSSADFGLFAVRVAASPLALSLGPLALRPAAGLDAGALFASGTGPVRSLDVTRPWLAATLGGGADLALVGALSLRLAGGLLVPVTRDTFLFEKPVAVVHDVPPLGGFASFGLGVRVGASP